MEAGYGVELDVQLSSDGEVMVFHDDRLERMTAGHGRLCEHRAAELATLALDGGDQRMPTLAETLEVVAGRQLVIVELKVLGGEEGPLETRVADLLDAYCGPAAVLSFNPNAVSWFAARRPQRLRGLNSLAYTDAAMWPISPAERERLMRLEHVQDAKPHFVGLGLDALPSPEADALRAQGLAVVAWTVRRPDQWARVSGHCDTFIFEGWRP
jgi:glycerophosphoryl diester phosphodiesterase